MNRTIEEHPGDAEKSDRNQREKRTGEHSGAGYLRAGQKYIFRFAVRLYWRGYGVRKGAGVSSLAHWTEFTTESVGTAREAKRLENVSFVCGCDYTRLFCLVVPKMEHLRQVLEKRNGGDDETRTRDLCRDRARFPSPAPDSKELTRRRRFPFFKTTIFLPNFMENSVRTWSRGISPVYQSVIAR